jgi:uncharacterized membrane protein YfcA
MIYEFSLLQLLLICLIFVWSGFVRSGFGFGGAALALPLMLFVFDQAIYWMPIIAIQLMLFTGITIGMRWRQVAWDYLRRALLFIIPASFAGVLGLIKLPNEWMLIIIYGITLTYAVLWLTNRRIRSRRERVDNLLLVVGSYFSGSSLTGAPLLSAVFLRNVALPHLRNTMFVVWFIICALKMSAFIALDVPIDLATALLLVPVTAIGHVVGLKAHDYILRNDALFKRVIGGVLIIVCLAGLAKVVPGMNMWT